MGNAEFHKLELFSESCCYTLSSEECFRIFVNNTCGGYVFGLSQFSKDSNTVSAIKSPLDFFFFIYFLKLPSTFLTND